MRASIFLMHHPGRGDGENACGRQKQAEMPEDAAPREQGDRGDDQRDLQEDFAKIEAVGFAVGEREFSLEFVAFGFELFLVLFVDAKTNPIDEPWAPSSPRYV